MQIYYGRLSERERRQYAAVEAIKLGYGGVSYISRLLSINRNTVMLGIKELEGSCDEKAVAYTTRQRKVGGGRKKNFGRI